jgi:hypothetical protein
MTATQYGSVGIVPTMGSIASAVIIGILLVRVYRLTGNDGFLWLCAALSLLPVLNSALTYGIHFLPGRTIGSVSPTVIVAGTGSVNAAVKYVLICLGVYRIWRGFPRIRNRWGRERNIRSRHRFLYYIPAHKREPGIAPRVYDDADWPRSPEEEQAYEAMPSDDGYMNM